MVNTTSANHPYPFLFYEFPPTNFTPQQALSGRAGNGEDGSSDVERSKRAGNGRVEGGAVSEVPRLAWRRAMSGVRKRNAGCHADAQDASRESVGRSEVRAEVSGAMSQDCSNVSGTRGLHKKPASASYNPNCTFWRGRLVSRSG